MIESNRPDVVIVNRNYPPRKGVTGESACSLATFLRDNYRLNVSVVTVRSEYAGGGSPLEPVGDVYELASLYDGKKKLLRLFANFVESFRLIGKAKRLKGKAIIVMTDPPFLSTWAALRFRKRQKWGLWSMDLYPDAFQAGNLVKKHSPIFQLFHRIVYRKPPNFLIALGPEQSRYVQDQYDEQVDTTILPCGVFQPTGEGNLPDWKTENSDKIILGYCGNLGEAHSPEFVQAVIDQFDPSRFHLILSVYGSKANEILDTLELPKQGITLVDSVSRDQLRYIDVHLVSLLSKWSHVCVPSKAVSAVCSESTILFYGSTNCDNWKMLGDAGWIIPETGDVTELRRRVADQIQAIDQDSVRRKQKAAVRISSELNRQIEVSYHEIGLWLGNTECQADNSLRLQPDQLKSLAENTRS